MCFGKESSRISFHTLKKTLAPLLHYNTLFTTAATITSIFHLMAVIPDESWSGG